MTSEHINNTLLSLAEKLEQDSVNILHLSDLHFGIENMPGNNHIILSSQRKDLFQRLIETIADTKKVPKSWKPEIIIISGDIAYTGNNDEYTLFKEELYPLLSNLIDSPDNDRIIMCPGNHDIIRKRVKNICKRPEKGVYEIPNDIPELTIETASDQNNGRWHHFEYYVANCCSGRPEELCRTVTFEEWPWLHFLVLNSAWDCQDDEDSGRLRVGNSIANELWANTEKKDDDIFVAVFHHPIMDVLDQDKDQHEIVQQWLHCSEIYRNDNKGKPNFGGFISRAVDIVLNGHIHCLMPPVQLNRSIHFINGTLHSNDTYTYSCRIIKFHKYSSPEYIELSRMLSETNGKWTVTVPKTFDEGTRNGWTIARENLIRNFTSNVSSDDELLLIIYAIMEGLFRTGIENNSFSFEQTEDSKSVVRLREK